MKKVRLYEEFVNQNINEAKRGEIHKAAKKGSYPVTIVVIKDDKVIAQELVKTPEAVPAAFNVIQSYHKHKGATIRIESKTGETLFSESVVTEATDLNDPVLLKMRVASKRAADMKKLDALKKKEAKAKIKAMKSWNQKKYDKWLEDVASNGGAENAFDMAKNAEFEPGLIDWVEKNFRGDDPLQRIQWDIEAFAESVVTEKREDVGKYNTLKKAIKAIKKEYGPTPTEQSVASFITDNYYDVTEVERGDDDPRANDKIADLIAHYKFDIEEWEIAWEDAQNESLQLDEGTMSDIHQLAGEVKDIAVFVKEFFKRFGDKIKKSKESIEWVESLYKDMKLS